jgi:hypothetical protein
MAIENFQWLTGKHVEIVMAEQSQLIEASVTNGHFEPISLNRDSIAIIPCLKHQNNFHHRLTH